MTTKRADLIAPGRTAKQQAVKEIHGVIAALEFYPHWKDTMVPHLIDACRRIELLLSPPKKPKEKR